MFNVYGIYRYKKGFNRDILFLDSPLLPSHGLKLTASHLAALSPSSGQLAFQQVPLAILSYLQRTASLSAGIFSYPFLLPADS